MTTDDQTPKVTSSSTPRGKKCTTTFDTEEADTKRDIEVAPSAAK
jgi:hypothetical protein